MLDSFALLAYLEGERGGPVVQTLLSQAQAGAYDVYLSLINLGEAAYIVERERGLPAAQRMLAAVAQLPIHIVAATRERVLAAAHFKAHYPIAYADAFAAAAAQEAAATLVTGDPEFKALSDAGLIQVRWLGQSHT